MVSLRRIEPEKNMARFYEISLQPTLFGDVAVVRHWGRIGGGEGPTIASTPAVARV